MRYVEEILPQLKDGWNQFFHGRVDYVELVAKLQCSKIAVDGSMSKNIFRLNQIHAIGCHSYFKISKIELLESLMQE